VIAFQMTKQIETILVILFFVFLFISVRSNGNNNNAKENNLTFSIFSFNEIVCFSFIFDLFSSDLLGKCLPLAGEKAMRYLLERHMIEGIFAALVIFMP
jgi:fumarate reductase subunit C